jgi:hypothetical protein
MVIGSQRGEEMHLNPIRGEAGPRNRRDQVILLCRVFLKPSEPLPTDPLFAPRLKRRKPNP